MKRNLRFFASAVATISILASCAEEMKEATTPNDDSDVTTNVPSEGCVTITFKAEYPSLASEQTPASADAATRTTIDDNGNVSWKVGDKIGLYYMEGNNPAFAAATALDEGASAEFQVSIPDGVTSVYAVYPADKGELSADGVFKVKTSSTQDGAFEKVNYAAAWSEVTDEMNLKFKNVVGMFRVKLPEGGILKDGSVNHVIKSIGITGKKAELAFLGDVTVTVENGALAFSAPENGVGEAVIELNDQTRNAGYVYIPSLPVNSPDGLVFRFMNAEGKYLPAAVTKDDKAINLERGHLKPVNTACESVIFDWYFAADGQGDGKSASSPAGVAEFQKLLNDSQYLYGERRLDGARLNLAAGTYSLTEQIVIKGTEMINIVINGANMEETKIEPGELATQMIKFQSPANLLISDMTFQNSNNKEKGSAISTENATGSLTMKNCKFYNNTTTGSNSGAIIVGTAARFEDCVFESNTAKTQGGAFSIGGSVTADVIVKNCTFKSNKVTDTSSNGGGAIYHAGVGSLLIDNCSFLNNSANKQGGAIKQDDKVGNKMFITRSLFRSNTVAVSGFHQPDGCAAVFQGAATKSVCGLYNCTFSYNHASAESSQTPSIRMGRYVIANCTFVEATASGYGAVNSAATSADHATLVNSIITINSGTEAHVSLSTKTSKNDDGTSTFNYLTSGYNLLTRILPGFTAASDDNTSKTGVYKSALNLGQEQDVDIENKCVTWGGDISSVDGYVNCSISDVERLIKSNTLVGQEFWKYLTTTKTAEGYSLAEVDVRGIKRDTDVMWPGSYQDALVVPSEPTDEPVE